MDLADITRDARCQSRVEMNADVVTDYADAMRSGATFPPITVFHDGQTHWLADGFHRVAAAEQAGIITIAADIRQGGIRDAELHAVSANATHGLRRTTADKRRAVELLLNDPEWVNWSDSEIARRCVVDHKTVARIRGLLGNSQVSTERTYTTKHGTIASMSTTNIGKTEAPNAVVHLDADTSDLRSTLKRLIVRYGVDRVRHEADIVLRGEEAA